MTYKMTGAPTRGVITFMGMTLPPAGKVLNKLQSIARQAPISIEPGTRIRCVLIPNTIRVRCGTAKPRNEIGPQKAVVVAVSNPEDRSNPLRLLRTFTPRLAA